MDIAREKAEQSAPEGLVVQAAEQVSARGRRGNQWDAPKGNLYQSIILRPTVGRQYWGQLSFVIAVALAQSCLKVGFLKDNIQLKWPNDVLINDQKLAGILIEVQDDFLILGTGVNVKLSPEGKSKIGDAADISVNGFRDVFLEQIGHYYTQWQDQGFEPIRTEWMKYAYRLGKTIQARLPNEVYEGVFEDLTEQGILLLREKDGNLRQITSGEILNYRDTEAKR